MPLAGVVKAILKMTENTIQHETCCLLKNKKLVQKKIQPCEWDQASRPVRARIFLWLARCIGLAYQAQQLMVFFFSMHLFFQFKYSLISFLYFFLKLFGLFFLFFYFVYFEKIIIIFLNCFVLCFIQMSYICMMYL